ncbi:hypothetical protein GF337_14035 [candidate division KSB1 bacterium]|nr:hypothetical protein [candidate division KSB1 bacterium]
MKKENITGEEALVWGALKNKTGYIAGHTGIFTHLSQEASESGYPHIHPCYDGKMCIDQAIGASYANTRSLLYLKNAEFSQCIYPLHLAALHEIYAGIIIIVRDDPGAWNSPTEQDSRSMTAAQHIPILEPSSPQEGFDIIAEAYRISETYHLPVVIRITTSYVVMKTNIEIRDKVLEIGNDKPNERWITKPAVAVEHRDKLMEKLTRIESVIDKTQFNTIIGTGANRIIVSGQIFSKLVEVIGSDVEKKCAILKISALFPPPVHKIKQSLEKASKVLVLEENDSFIENIVKEVAQSNNISIPVWGRHTGHVPKSGELFKWQIEDILSKFIPGFQSAGFFFPYQEKKVRTNEEKLCFGCPYYSIFNEIKEICDSFPVDAQPIFIGDPGCPSRLGDQPYDMVKIVSSTGSAIGIASGIGRFEKDRRVIAVTDDVSFFQGGFSSLIEAGYQHANIVVLILDTSYVQKEKERMNNNFGHGPIPLISIEELILSAQINYHRVIEQTQFSKVKTVFKRAVENSGLSVVVIKNVCSLIS